MSVFVVADPGANWRASPDEPLDQGWDRFRWLIEVCAAAGADGFKPQFVRRTIYPEGSVEAAIIAGYEWPEVWLPLLKDACDEAGIEFMCTVYEPEHVPLIDPYVKRHKIASFELQRVDLLRAVAATRKPVCISTGGSTWDQAAKAVVAAKLEFRATLLHCVSAYPAALEHMNLRCLRTLASYGIAPGLSDHSPPGQVVTAAMAVALGAQVIETHVRLNDCPNSPDFAVARDPLNFADYVTTIRLAELALGDGFKQPQEGEWLWARWNPETGKRGVRPP